MLLFYLINQPINKPNRVTCSQPLRYIVTQALVSSFSTPIRQSLSYTYDGTISNNSFGVLQNENLYCFRTFDLSGYENINVLIARESSRGGRPYKPTQKLQEWIQVGGRTRGRSGCSGHGHPN